MLQAAVKDRAPSQTDTPIASLGVSLARGVWCAVLPLHPDVLDVGTGRLAAILLCKHGGSMRIKVRWHCVMLAANTTQAQLEYM